MGLSNQQVVIAKTSIGASYVVSCLSEYAHQKVQGSCLNMKCDIKFCILYSALQECQRPVSYPVDQHITYNNRRSNHGHNKQLEIESANSELCRIFPKNY